MARNTGLSYLSNSFLGGLRRKISSVTDKFDDVTSARVTDISLNSNSPLWEKTGEWQGIGTIQFQFIDSATTDQTLAFRI